MHVRSRHQLRDFRDLLLATEEWGQRRREIPGSLIGGNREVDILRQVRMDEDEDAFGALDVAQPHLAELLETCSRWQPVLRQLFHCLGQQDLPTPRHAEQPRQDG